MVDNVASEKLFIVTAKIEAGNGLTGVIVLKKPYDDFRNVPFVLFVLHSLIS